MSEAKLAKMSLADLREVGASVVLHFDFNDPTLTREDILAVLRANSL